MRSHVTARQRELLDLVRDSGTITVSELAERLDVHVMTIRRDLHLLTEHHRVEWRHGRVLWPRTPWQPDPPAPDHGVTVGMVVPVRDYYYAEVIRGAQAVAAEQGVRLVVSLTEYLESNDGAELDRLLGEGVQGVLFTPAGDSTMISSDVLDTLADRRSPLVIMERSLPAGHPLAGHDSVFADHAHGVGVAVRYLADVGRQRVIMMNRHAKPGTRYRDGYLAAMRSLGLPLPTPPMESVEESRPFAEAIRSLVRLVRAGRADGIIIQNDSSAIDVVRALLQEGIRIPRDLAVIAYDDELAELCEIPLTAVSPPKRLVGARALERLLHKIAAAGEPAGDRVPEPSWHLGLVPELVLRDSTPG
ncbi:substrate-binding domain-containing protein [Microlunatus sp. GCM10028923]|uniref:LacI family DNA-binding transcriptional regulator n=1 Tax=Microlunatus sp. GCM10028923 TaxID=3273400 RepID=UPI00361889C5